MSGSLTDHVSRRNYIMDIAEAVAPFFRSRMHDVNGNPARFVSVRNVEFQVSDLGNITQTDIQIELLSDQGSWTQPVILRSFQSKEVMNLEVDRYTELERRCLLFPDVSPLPMITIDNDGLTIVYEKLPGLGVHQLTVPSQVIERYLGRLMAILHGEGRHPLEQTSMRELMIFILTNGLPFTDEERESVASLLESQFDRLEHADAGYIPVVAFDPVNMYMSKRTMGELTVDKISKGEAFDTAIPMRYTAYYNVDRCADIAALFGDRAYNEFCRDGMVAATVNSMHRFLLGYQHAMGIIGVPSWSQMYHIGPTIDLQMLTRAWYLATEKIQAVGGTTESVESREVLSYTYHILMNQPFSTLLLQLEADQ